MNRRTFLKAIAWAGSVVGGLIPLPKPKVKNHRLCACAITVFGIDNKLYKYSVDYGYSWHIGTWAEFMDMWSATYLYTPPAKSTVSIRDYIVAQLTDSESFREAIKQKKVEK